MEVLQYRENNAGNKTVRMEVDLNNDLYDVEYRHQEGPTAGLRVEREEETIYTGSVHSNYPPSEQEEVLEHFWNALNEGISGDVIDALKENPEKVRGVPGDEVIYVPENEFDIPKR